MPVSTLVSRDTADGEEHDAHVKRCLIEARDIAGIEERKEAQEKVRQADADRSCSETNQDRFREELADDAAASRSECNAHAQLAHAARGTGQQQIGRVAAGDQQDNAHSTEQQPKQRTDMAHSAVNEVLYQGAPTLHLRVVELVEAHHDGGHLRLRLGDGDAGLKSSHCISAGVVAIGHFDGR